MARGHHIVVVDDEPELRGMLADYLGQHGFEVETAANAEELDACLARGAPDLVILDVNMPGENGLSVARRLGETGDVPILMLTALDTAIDRVVGLELGADDYVAKPVDLRELRARVSALIRRSKRVPKPPVQTPAPAPAQTAMVVAIGGLTLNLDARQLTRPTGDVIELTAMEFDLLAAFVANPNRVLTRERLLTLTHVHDADVFDRSIDVRITRLRRKIEVDPARPELIRTLRGAGYMFVPSGA